MQETPASANPIPVAIIRQLRDIQRQAELLPPIAETSAVIVRLSIESTIQSNFSCWSIGDQLAT